MQQQFLHVVDRDEAERRFVAALDLSPIAEQLVPLERLLGRVLSRDVVSPVDVPSFDRANYDGFAVQAADTFEADEEHPRSVRCCEPPITPGFGPQRQLAAGEAIPIATGAIVPRGADAVAMIEHCDHVEDGRVLLRKPVAPGFGITFAGTDIASGETILAAGELLTSRETGVLAATGISAAHVWQRPRVAIVSTGDEIVPPDSEMQPGLVYDSNAQILADAVQELGGDPIRMGIVGDDEDRLNEVIADAMTNADVVVLSGGTSKGQGDLCYRIVGELASPGIVAHGVALKPGKPICLAAHEGKPIVILPGFPTSAIFTFHEFVAPVIRTRAGRPRSRRSAVAARLAVQVNSEIGRTEYLLVSLVDASGETTSQVGDKPLVAYPIGKGSGSVTTFSYADGFITIDRHVERLDQGTRVEVQLIGSGIEPADLIVIGSHCIGLDHLLGQLQLQGWRTKFLAVGSTAGLAAARRGECDLAGIHLLDPASGKYNRPFVDDSLELIEGYGRRQGVLYRVGDPRFAGRTANEAIAAACQDPDCLMINRNQGSGTRILIDELLDRVAGGQQPPGYAVQAKNHNAIAAAVRQSRADWGVAIESVAQHPGRMTGDGAEALDFLHLADEQFDFVVPKCRRSRPAVEAFVELLRQTDVALLPGNRTPS